MKGSPSQLHLLRLFCFEDHLKLRSRNDDVSAYTYCIDSSFVLETGHCVSRPLHASPSQKLLKVRLSLAAAELEW